jgi:hypothetical protein
MNRKHPDLYIGEQATQSRKSIRKRHQGRDTSRFYAYLRCHRIGYCSMYPALSTGSSRDSRLDIRPPNVANQGSTRSPPTIGAMHSLYIMQSLANGFLNAPTTIKINPDVSRFELHKDFLHHSLGISLENQPRRSAVYVSNVSGTEIAHLRYHSGCLIVNFDRSDGGRKRFAFTPHAAHLTQTSPC